MPTNKVRLEICGCSYVISTTDSEEYTLSLAEKLDRSMGEILAQNPTASVTAAAVLSALDYLDELEKASASADNMRSQIRDYLEDAAKAKLEAEASNPQADVIVLASWSDGLSMKEDGQIVSYKPANYDKMGEAMVDDDYMLYGTSASAVGVIYNKEAFPDGLDADWAAFGTEEFADVAMEIPDPTKSGACKDFLAGFSTGIENGDAILQSWVDNGLKNGGGNNPAIEAV